MYERDRVSIGGEWVKPNSSEIIEVISPSTEQVIGKAACASSDDVDRAVEIAKCALTSHFSRMDVLERVEIIRHAAKILESRAEELALLLAMEMGAPIGRDRRGVVPATIKRMIDGFPAAACHTPSREVRRDSDGAVLVHREPIGVVAAIVPWNSPFTMAALKVIPALLAGCPVVLKPSPLSPLDAYVLAEVLFEAGLPEEMLSVLPGGSDVGEAMVKHRDVRMVTFTGSSEIGRKVATMCGDGFKRVVLECGGKSPAIVLRDADLEESVRLISYAAFGWANGQYCRSLSRVLVPRERHDEFAEALSIATKNYPLGDPSDPATVLGPLVSRQQREKVESYFQIALDEGASIASGGRRPPELDHGWYVEPTVFVGANNNMRIAQEEIFGPATLLMPYDSVDEAVAIANDSQYGLAGCVFTTDPVANLDVALRLQAGLVGINAQGARENAPSGGLKDSGVGQEHGAEGSLEFLQTMSIIIPDDLATHLEQTGVPTTNAPKV